MTDLAQFLRDRFAERRAIAEAAPPWPWQVNPEDPDEVIASDGIVVADAFALSGRQTRATAVFIATNDPAEVLADLDAKRAMLDLHDQAVEWYGAPENRHHPAGEVHGLREAIKLLAKPFAGHPEYRGEWAG